MSRSAIRISALFAVALAIAPAHAQRPGQGEDDSAALVDEGRAALKRGDLEGASKALDQAIALNPRRVEAYVLRSAVHAHGPVVTYAEDDSGCVLQVLEEVPFAATR